jgi:hypothetical protein
MPFKSKAQRRFFYAAAERGDIPKSKVKEYEEKTRGGLPEKVSKKNPKSKAKDYARKQMSRKDA